MNSEGKVDSSVAHLLRYSNSVETKLKSSEYHLNTILSLSATIVSSVSVSEESGSSNSTVSPINAILSATNASPVTEDDISRELGDFFHNLLSAFESLAQLMNCIYSSSCLNEGNVTFPQKMNEMLTSFPNEALTVFLISMKRKGWYRNMQRFRKSEYHVESIRCYINYGRVFWEPSCKPEIWLPDDPRSKKPTHFGRMEINKTLGEIFTEALRAINNIYSIMEARISVADCIPV